ncbi:rod shape-determining protein MreC [Treponema sp.]
MRHDEEHLPRKRQSAEAYVFIALIFFSFSLLLISTRSFMFDVRDLGLSLYSGARSGIFSITSFTSRTFNSIKELADLKKDYVALSARLERFQALERDAAEIKRENFQLREQLGFSESLRYRHIPARIVGRDPDNLFSAFVIDVGSKKGMKRNMPVIAYQDGLQALVGKVVQVGRYESLVMPLYDAEAFVSGRFATSRYEGIVSGEGSADLPLRMNYVKKRANDEINFGDMVVTSGLGGIYPQDLSIGRVSKVLFQEFKTSIEVELEPVIDFSRLEYVFAIESETEAIQQ